MLEQWLATDPAASPIMAGTAVLCYAVFHLTIDESFPVAVGAILASSLFAAMCVLGLTLQ